MTQRRPLPKSALRGDDLRSLRERAGLSQTDLAVTIGYSLKQVQRWERGEIAPRLAAFEFLRSRLDQPKSLGTTKAFKFIDLFAGVGGLRIGFEGIGGECVFTSEWDRYARVTYEANFSVDHAIGGDIVAIASEIIPPHDVLLAGFPCQPFSIAGVSKKNALGRPHGFACDTQGTLFYEVARILNYHRPRFFLLENVKNLVTHDSRRTFETIKRVLREELGYRVYTKVIDAKPFLPQHRERIFIVGIRDDSDFSWDGLHLPLLAAGPKLGAILHPEDGSELPEPPYTTESGRVNRKYKLSDHLWNYLQAYAAKHKKQGNGFGFGLVGPEDIARTLSARYYKDGSEILVRTKSGSPRRLTPRECARLMGFDSADRKFVIPVSDTQAYKQFGNSVAVPVVQAVAQLMRPHILGEEAIASEQLSLPLLKSA